MCVKCGGYTESEWQVMISLPGYLMYYMHYISGWHITPYSKAYFLTLDENKCEQRLLKNVFGTPLNHLASEIYLRLNGSVTSLKPYTLHSKDWNYVICFHRHHHLLLGCTPLPTWLGKLKLTNVPKSSRLYLGRYSIMSYCDMTFVLKPWYHIICIIWHSYICES